MGFPVGVVVFGGAEDSTQRCEEGRNARAPEPFLYTHIKPRYNRQTARVAMKDQNETVHEYTYDHLGRLIRDAATEFGGVTSTGGFDELNGRTRFGVCSKP